MYWVCKWVSDSSAAPSSRYRILSLIAIGRLFDGGGVGHLFCPGWCCCCCCCWEGGMCPPPMGIAARCSPLVGKRPPLPIGGGKPGGGMLFPLFPTPPPLNMGGLFGPPPPPFPPWLPGGGWLVWSAAVTNSLLGSLFKEKMFFSSKQTSYFSCASHLLINIKID